MEYKTDIPTDHPGSDPPREGDIGLFQTLGLGLLVFTVLMVLMAVGLSLFLDLGD